MTYNDVKEISIPMGKDTVIFDVITNTGNKYLVASRSTEGARKKVCKFEEKNITFISIKEIMRGVL